MSGRHAGKVEYFPPEPPPQECPAPPARLPWWCRALVDAIRGSGGSLSAILGHLAEVRAFRRWRAADPDVGLVVDERFGPVVESEAWVAALAAGDDPFDWRDGERSLSGAIVAPPATHDHLPAQLVDGPARQAHALLVAGLVTGYLRGMAAAAAAGLSRDQARRAQARLEQLELALRGREHRTWIRTPM